MPELKEEQLLGIKVLKEKLVLNPKTEKFMHSVEGLDNGEFYFDKIYECLAKLGKIKFGISRGTAHNALNYGLEKVYCCWDDELHGIITYDREKRNFTFNGKMKFDGISIRLGFDENFDMCSLFYSPKQVDSFKRILLEKNPNNQYKLKVCEGILREKVTEIEFTPDAKKVKVIKNRVPEATWTEIIKDKVLNRFTVEKDDDIEINKGGR